MNSITKMKEAIDALIKNDLKKALSFCEDVDRLEHEADDQKKMLIESLIHSKLEPVTFSFVTSLRSIWKGD